MSETKSEPFPLTHPFWFVVGCAIFTPVLLFCIGKLYVWLLSFWGEKSTDAIQMGGQLGDHFGFLNAVISLVAITVIYRTYRSQQENHKAEMQRLEESAKSESARHEEQVALLKAQMAEDTAAQKRQTAISREQIQKSENAALLQERERHFFSLMDIFKDELRNRGLLVSGDQTAQALKPILIDDSAACSRIANGIHHGQTGIPFSTYAGALATKLSQDTALLVSPGRNIYSKFCLAYDYLCEYAPEKPGDMFSGYALYFRVLFSFLEERLFRLMVIHYLHDKSKYHAAADAVFSAQLLVARYRFIGGHGNVEREGELAKALGVIPSPQN